MGMMNTENLTTGSLWKKILLFSLPLAATSVLQQLFNAADLAVIGSYTGEMGEICMAAVGSTAPIIGLIVNAFVGLSIGTNVLIAAAIGTGDKHTVHRIVHTSVLFSLLVGIFVLVFGNVFAKSLLAVTDVPEDVLPLAAKYLQIYFLGAPAILLYNFEAAIFRAKGDTRTPLFILAVSGVINVLLNLFFVIVLHMTVEGVAIATIASNIIGAVVLFVLLMRANDETQVSIRRISMSRNELIGILKIGVPSGLQSSVFSIANIVMQAAINSLDTTTMAASSAAVNVETFAYFLFTGFSQACVTFVGQNRGAQKFDRCKKALWVSMIEAWIGLAFAIVLLLVAGKPILSLFNDNPAVIDIAFHRVTFIITYAYLFAVLYEVLGSYLRGMGISLLPAILTMIGVCGSRITWIMTAFKSDPTFDTVLWAFPISMSFTALLMAAAVLVLKPDRKIMKQSFMADSEQEQHTTGHIITIGHEFGSGGRELGKRLADALGYVYYDKEIVSEIAEKINLDESYVEDNAEQIPTTSSHYVVGSTFSHISPMNERTIQVITEQRAILQRIAQKGENCVIVGRAADITLAGYAPLKIFVYADTASKLRRCKSRADTQEQMTDKEMLRKMKRIDKARAQYYDMISTTEWGKKNAYQLCINTTDVSIKAIVPMVADYARDWFDGVKESQGA